MTRSRATSRSPAAAIAWLEVSRPRIAALIRISAVML
jgi:hypothetical protein